MQDTTSKSDALDGNGLPSSSNFGLILGLLAATFVAITAAAVGRTLGGPAALYVTVIGVALSPFMPDSLRPGLDFAGGPLLRVAIALLGFRISFDHIAELGFQPLALIMASIAIGIAFSVMLARKLRLGTEFGLIAGMAVAICGVSAALAAAALVPRTTAVARDVLYVAVLVTLLSTVAMIAYPYIAIGLGFSESTVGVFLGATIHDLAQVVGAGYGVSPAVGDAAVVTKLARISFLAPCVVLAAVFFRFSTEQKSGVSIPWFVLAFVAIALANTVGIVPESISRNMADASGYAFLIALSAICLRMKWADIVVGDWRRALLILAHTGLLACVVAIGLSLLAHP
jgi:uncharacterized integral membrane protein (TIGR00698 family)